MTSFSGTAGDDHLVGTAGNDTFNVSQGGDDIVSGGAGDDIVNFGAAFTAADSVDGGAGSDKIILSGDYSALVTLGAATLLNVDQIQFDAGHTYNLVSADQTVAAGATLTLNGSALGVHDHLYFDGRAETDGRFHFIDGAGNDHLVGGAKNDLIDLSHGGNDFAQGGAGNDTFVMGDAFTAADQIKGGTGNDTVEISGGGNFAFTATTMLSVETVVLANSASGYNFTLNAATVAAGTTMTFDGTALTAGWLTVNAAAVTDASVVATAHGTGPDSFTGGSGDDDFHGGDGFNTFNLTHGGEDTAFGGSGINTFNFGAALSSGDGVTGDYYGNNTVTLSGDYSAGVTLNSPVELYDITTLTLGAGFVYNLGLDHSVIKTIDGSRATSFQIDASHMLYLNTVTGSHGDDILTMSAGSPEPAFAGGPGDDTLVIDGASTKLETQFRGGSGDNTLELNGDITLDLQDASGINQIVCAAGHSYGVIDDYSEIGKNPDLTVDGRLLDASESLSVAGHNGSGPLVLLGGAGDDYLQGHGSFIEGGGGADILLGGWGQDVQHDPTPTAADTFAYTQVSDSTSTAYDKVEFYDPSQDVFQLWFAVTAVETPVNGGALSTATFDTDLASAIGASQLGAHHAVLFTPDSGTLKGGNFLIVDANGIAGYQAGQDLVISVSNESDPPIRIALTTADFTT